MSQNNKIIIFGIVIFALVIVALSQANKSSQRAVLSEPTAPITKTVDAQPETNLSSDATALGLSAGTSNLKIGESTLVTLTLNTGVKNNVTTVKATFNFDPSALQIEGNLNVNSLFALTGKNEVDNTAGKIELATASSAPQNGNQITVASFKVKALQAGNFKLAFDPNNSAVLLNDKNNTNALKDLRALDLTITGGSTTPDSQLAL